MFLTPQIRNKGRKRKVHMATEPDLSQLTSVHFFKTPEAEHRHPSFTFTAALRR